MLYGLAIVLIPLFIGYLFRVTNRTLLNIINKIVTACLYFILLVIGISLGQLDDIVTKLPQIGTTALGLGGIIYACNMLALMLYDKLRPIKLALAPQAEGSSRFFAILDSFKLIGATLCGGCIGFLTKTFFLFPSNASTYVLVVMILGVGIQLRNSGIPIKEVFLNQRGIYTAIIFSLSSLFGGIISAFVLDLSLIEGLTFASAFGWYSLSSALISDAYGAVYGSIAFFNDLSRELLCFFFMPILMRLYPSTAVGLGGATSLDCTLPILQKAGGIQVVPLAISFGFIVNLLAPLLLAIFIGLGSA